MSLPDPLPSAFSLFHFCSGVSIQSFKIILRWVCSVTKSSTFGWMTFSQEIGRKVSGWTSLGLVTVRRASSPLLRMCSERCICRSIQQRSEIATRSDSFARTGSVESSLHHALKRSSTIMRSTGHILSAGALCIRSKGHFDEYGHLSSSATFSWLPGHMSRSEEHTSELQSLRHL